MADLQSCYFCGAPDDLGEYAVVPPRLGGGDRSVVLCSDCKTKLLRVMEPLIERADADGNEAGDGSAANGPTADADGDSAPAADGITMSPGERSEGGSTAGGASDGESAASAMSTGESDDTPPQYRRAMRMLSNRPFPLDRTEAESMLANAYDLEREEIEAVLEHAASEGRLVVEDGQLREP